MLKLLRIVILFLFLGMVCTSDAKADNSFWMVDLDQNKLITQISIPGTHDSATGAGRCGIWPYCTAQTYGFTYQLDKGIRFFDIRLAYEDGDLKFYHNIYDLNLNFKAVINVVEAHLLANPSESVIFLIKQEHSDVSADTFWARVKDQIDDYPAELFHLDKSVPTVAEAAGKIIIMARNKSTHPQGYHVNWTDNKVHYEGSDSDLRYVVEDHYSLATVGRDTKFAEVAQNLYLAGVCATCGNPKTLFITFLSGTGVKLASYEPSYYAAYENPHTADWLNNRPGPRPGVVVMDFAGDSHYDGNRLIQEVINQNIFPDE